jgi:DNA-binding transcriptional regulator GbsR (MarR family)
MDNKMTIDEAAELMGVSKQFVRVGLQKGIFPWGYAVQVSSKRYTYFISRQKFCETEGIVPSKSN